MCVRECISPIFTICCKADAENSSVTLLLRHSIVESYLFRRQFCPKFGAQFFNVPPWTNCNLAYAHSLELTPRITFSRWIPSFANIRTFFPQQRALFTANSQGPCVSQQNFLPTRNIDPFDVWADQHLKTAETGPGILPPLEFLSHVVVIFGAYWLCNRFNLNLIEE